MSNLYSAARTAFALSLIGLTLGACGSIDRLSNVGKAPDLSSIQDPTAQPGYKPVRMPMPNPQPSSYAASSLWRTGSRAFFKDQRAQQVGDIVTVLVKVTDKANLDNETKRARTSSDKIDSMMKLRPGLTIWLDCCTSLVTRAMMSPTRC